MKRTPIIVPGQVYLHGGYNEYLVVTKVNRTDVGFSGPGFSGMNDSELFLERFGPVDPVDLSADETLVLQGLSNDKPLCTGWVQPDDDDGEDNED